eukprot:m.114004 g.114004  ORF g.114004 m.114004 type:complete len:175 (-) comp14150_c0_seq17:1488-2012(-)
MESWSFSENVSSAHSFSFNYKFITRYTPTRRGFSTFLGYYAACQVDYWYHGAPPNECGQESFNDPVTDFSNNTGANILPAYGLNGTYNEDIFTDAAVNIINQHSTHYKYSNDSKPFYIYLAYHNVHGAVADLPVQAPCETVDMCKLVVGTNKHLINHGLGIITLRWICIKLPVP